MNRRRFLTISLMGLGSLLLPSQVLAMNPARSLKASAGKILARAADGVSWEARVNLGPDVTILDLYESLGVYFAKVNCQGHIFFLKSTDATTWYTYDWSAPSTWQYRSAEKSHG
ncbi:MAG TPA: hypothetical protein VGJ97_02975 [Anaerolineaceae bacterium]